MVNDRNIFADTKSYIQRIAPEKADIVSFYQNGSPIFDSFGITKQVKSSFGKTVNLDSGAYVSASMVCFKRGSIATIARAA